jgi:hypothetical protein
MQQTIIPDSASQNRNEAVVTFWMHAAHLPAIFHDTTSLILHNADINYADLLLRAQSAYDKYQLWWRRWQASCEKAANNLSLQINRSDQIMIQTFCSYLEHVCLASRLLSALNRSLGIELENTIVQTAQDLLNICGCHDENGHPRYTLLLSKTVAEATLKTTGDWVADLEGLNTKETIEPKVFRTWCMALQRKVE